MRTRLLSLLLLVTTVFAGVTAPVAPVSAASTTYATTTAVNFRAEPSLDAEIMWIVPAGADVIDEDDEVVDGFRSVAYAGVEGWIYDDYLRVGDTIPSGGFPDGSDVWVSTDRLNLRADPGLDGDVLKVLTYGDFGSVYGPPVTADGYLWYPIVIGEGASAETGWAAGEFLSGGINEGERAQVADGPLNLRAAAGLNADIVAAIPEGTEVDILSFADHRDGYAWYYVNTDEFGAGFVVGLFLGPI